MSEFPVVKLKKKVTGRLYGSSAMKSSHEATNREMNLIGPLATRRTLYRFISASICLLILLTPITAQAVTVIPGLEATMSASASSILSGDTVTYTITVTNTTSPGTTLTNVRLDDYLVDKPSSQLPAHTWPLNVAALGPTKGAILVSAQVTGGSACSIEHRYAPSQFPTDMSPLDPPITDQQMPYTQGRWYGEVAHCSIGTLTSGSSATVEVVAQGQLNNFQVQEPHGIFTNLAVATTEGEVPCSQYPLSPATGIDGVESQAMTTSDCLQNTPTPTYLALVPNPTSPPPTAIAEAMTQVDP